MKIMFNKARRIAALLMAMFFIMSPFNIYASAVITEQTPSGIPFSELENQIDTLVYKYLGTTTQGVAIVVVSEGEIIFSRGYGYANVEREIPIDPAMTVFEYASISKLFTWVAAMQLAEQELFNLDADVRTYLPASFVFDKPFTMRDLMNHMAGFADIAFPYTFDRENLPTLDAVLLATQPPQIFTPGTVSAYSNWGTALAGLVVAEISRQNFAAYERENILLPANMQQTLNLPDYFKNSEFLANQAQGYFVNSMGEFSNSTSRYVLDYPSGALRGTAEDLATFIKALTPPVGESGALFKNAQTLQTLFTSSSVDPINRPTTHHGFFSYSGAFPSFGHGGNLAGFSTDLVIVPELRFGFAVLINNSMEMHLIPQLGKLLLGSSQSPLPTSNLPNVQSMEGHFISARRFGGGNVTEIVDFMARMAQIQTLDENTIEFSYGMVGSAIYKQIEPYVFRVYDTSNSPLLGQRLPEFRIRMEDGAPVQIIVPSGGDFTSLPVGRTIPFLITSLISAVLSVAFFLIVPIVLFILFLIHRKKQIVPTRFERFSTGFLLSGTLLALNNIVLVLFANPIHIWINYVLAILVVLLFVGSIWSWYTAENEKTKRKILFGIMTAFMALFIFILHNWNFFVLF